MRGDLATSARVDPRFSVAQRRLPSYDRVTTLNAERLLAPRTSYVIVVIAPRADLGSR